MKGVLNLGTEYEYFDVVRPGDVITCEGRLVDAEEKEIKTGKMLMFTTEKVYTNQHGKVVAIERNRSGRY